MARRWGNILGFAVALLVMGLVLVFYGSDLRSVDFTNAAVLRGLAGSAALYLMVTGIGAVCWRFLLSALGSPPGRWVAERQLLISQIGKYVPGNVAQYVGRAAMAVNSGAPMKAVGIALVTETAATVLAGFLSVAALVALDPSITDLIRRVVPDISRVIWFGLATTGILAVALCASKILDLFKRINSWSGGLVVLAGIISLYVTSFLLLGLSLHVIVRALFSYPVPLTWSVAIFAVAWIAGLATPGAPGGLGVRESIITVALAPLVGGAVALSAALLHRGVSVLGDVISFGAGVLLSKVANANPGLSAQSRPSKATIDP